MVAQEVVAGVVVVEEVVVVVEEEERTRKRQPKGVREIALLPHLFLRKFTLLLLCKGRHRIALLAPDGLLLCFLRRDLAQQCTLFLRAFSQRSPHLRSTRGRGKYSELFTNTATTEAHYNPDQGSHRLNPSPHLGRHGRYRYDSHFIVIRGAGLVRLDVCHHGDLLRAARWIRTSCARLTSRAMPSTGRPLKVRFERICEGWGGAQ